MEETLTTTSLPGLEHLRSGKVRDIYRSQTGEILIIATDRISAYDVVFPDPIPHKGQVLTTLSAFWFSRLGHIAKHHLITTDIHAFPPDATPYASILKGRTMLCRPAKPLPVECVARGYLTGSVWEEYQRTHTIHGESAPSGLQANQRFSEPLFTPATKAESGHDQPLTFQHMANLIGIDTAKRLRDLTLELFIAASRIAEQKNIIIADTKLEFGWSNNELLWIDEAFTPDSSRFWDKQHYALGVTIPSLDKQYVRNYVTTSGWNRQPPAPHLPPTIIQQTSALYAHIVERLMGDNDSASL